MTDAFKKHAKISGVLSMIGTVCLTVSAFTPDWMITDSYKVAFFKQCSLSTGECGPASTKLAFDVIRGCLISSVVICYLGMLGFIVGCRLKKQPLLFFGGWMVFIGGLLISAVCIITTSSVRSEVQGFQNFGYSFVLGWIACLFLLWGSLWNCVAAETVDQVVTIALV